jgi:hypothetical protein
MLDVMKLEPFVDTLARELLTAAEFGGDETRKVAERLTAPLDAATRLVLLEALSTAAGEITLELAPGSVDLRLRGRDPEFVVTLLPQPSDAEQLPTNLGNPEAAPEGGDGGAARITLRLTEQTKLRIEKAAAKEGLSVNAWLGKVIARTLDGHDVHSGRGPPSGRRFTGWVR